MIRTAEAGSFDAAQIDLRDAPTGGAALALQLVAGRAHSRHWYADPGTWGNFIRADVDYDTTNPATLFNLTVRRSLTGRFTTTSAARRRSAI